MSRSARRRIDRTRRRVRHHRWRRVAMIVVLGGALAASDASHLDTTRSAPAPLATDAVPSPPPLATDTVTPVPRRAAPTVPVAVPAAMSRARPEVLRIPALDLQTTLVSLGLTDDGTLEVPNGAFPAGWYEGGPTPGELGPAVVAGHVDWGGRPGVFERLHTLAVGDEITIDREDGHVATFLVTRVTQVGKDAFPTDEVYGDLDHAGLRLITCGGRFDTRADSYTDNVVVFAELAA